MRIMGVRKEKMRLINKMLKPLLRQRKKTREAEFLGKHLTTIVAGEDSQYALRVIHKTKTLQIDVLACLFKVRLTKALDAHFLLDLLSELDSIKKTEMSVCDMDERVSELTANMNEWKSIAIPKAEALKARAIKKKWELKWVQTRRNRRVRR